MTDVWELASYVEAHPGDLDQRWRLAKKLYTSFEYRLALEHLLVLKNEWGPRAHVSRYLAATYYRLGRYEDAIREMRTALDKFPDDVGLREQLARTLVVDDQKEEAVAAWESVLKYQPDHPFAKPAIEKLKKSIEKRAKEQSKIDQAKAGAELEAMPLDGNPKELPCPSCGEINSAEFKRCWKCHALLETAPAPSSAFAEPPRAAPAQIRWPIVTGIAIASMLALGVFLTLRGLTDVQAQMTPDEPPPSVAAFLASRLFWTRIILGVALLIGWPMAWRVGAYFADVEGRIYNDTLYQYGALLALTAYALLWLPWRFLIAAAVAPILFSAVVAFLALAIAPRAAAKLWAIQFAGSLVIVLGVTLLRHGAGFVLEAPAIVSFAAKSNEATVYSSRLSAPGEIQVVWSSTGSRWLDQRASHVQITLSPGDRDHPLYLETVKPDGPPSYEHVRGEVFTSDMDAIQPGAAYVYRLQSKDEVAVDFTLKGLLRPSVQLSAAAAVPAGS